MQALPPQALPPQALPPPYPTQDYSSYNYVYPSPQYSYSQPPSQGCCSYIENPFQEKKYPGETTVYGWRGCVVLLVYMIAVAIMLIVSLLVEAVALTKALHILALLLWAIAWGILIWLACRFGSVWLSWIFAVIAILAWVIWIILILTGVIKLPTVST